MARARRRRRGLLRGTRLRHRAGLDPHAGGRQRRVPSASSPATDGVSRLAPCRAPGRSTMSARSPAPPKTARFFRHHRRRRSRGRSKRRARRRFPMTSRAWPPASRVGRIGVHQRRATPGWRPRSRRACGEPRGVARLGRLLLARAPGGTSPPAYQRASTIIKCEGRDHPPPPGPASGRRTTRTMCAAGSRPGSSSRRRAISRRSACAQPCSAEFLAQVMAEIDVLTCRHSPLPVPTLAESDVEGTGEAGVGAGGAALALHPALQPLGSPRLERAVRLQRERPAARLPADRQALRRGRAFHPGAQLSAGDGLPQTEPAALEPSF